MSEDHILHNADRLVELFKETERLREGIARRDCLLAGARAQCDRMRSNWLSEKALREKLCIALGERFVENTSAGDSDRDELDAIGSLCAEVGIIGSGPLEQVRMLVAMIKARDITPAEQQLAQIMTTLRDEAGIEHDGPVAGVMALIDKAADLAGRLAGTTMRVGMASVMLERRHPDRSMPSPGFDVMKRSSVTDAKWSIVASDLRDFDTKEDAIAATWVAFEGIDDDVQ